MSDEIDSSGLLDDGSEWAAPNDAAPTESWAGGAAPQPLPGWTPEESAPSPSWNSSGHPVDYAVEPNESSPDDGADPYAYDQLEQ